MLENSRSWYLIQSVKRQKIKDFLNCGPCFRSLKYPSWGRKTNKPKNFCALNFHWFGGYHKISLKFSIGPFSDPWKRDFRPSGKSEFFSFRPRCPEKFIFLFFYPCFAPSQQNCWCFCCVKSGLLGFLQH